MVLLKDKIYDIERENEMELFNMKERLTKLHEMDIEAITKRYEELLDTLRKERLDC